MKLLNALINRRLIDGMPWLLLAGCVATAASPQASAKDLWHLYQVAQRHNGNWAGQQYDYLANQKNEIFALGDMLPQVGLQGSVKHNQFIPKMTILATVAIVATVAAVAAVVTL